MELGLRERKKAATRAALGRAAALLAVRHGTEGVTVEAVAAEAGVSPRTFHNYFAGKEEAIVSVLTDGARAIVDGLRARPAGEDVRESLRQAVRGVLLPAGREPDDLALTLALLRVVKADPALVAGQLGGLVQTQREIAEIIAARTGTDAARDPYPHLLGGAAALAMRTVVDLWSDRPHRDLGGLLDEAFALLWAGLPAPAAPPPEP